MALYPDRVSLPIPDLIRFTSGVIALVTATFLLARYFRIGIGTLPYIAIIRAALQLGFIALVLRGILDFPAALPLFFTLMLTTASLTSGKHAKHLFHGKKAAALGIFCGATITVFTIFALGLIELTTQNLIAMGEIIIGGTMTIVTLTARNFTHTAHARTGEIEAWWALGATSPQAFTEIRRHAVKEALIPGLDQTRATGLVTLPGTFIGALMGGASPLVAAQMQLAVLAGQTLAGIIGALIFTTIICRSPHLPPGSE